MIVSRGGWTLRIDSIGYYAPEVFTDGLWTTAVDIYALGMAVIHLLSGCHPYGEQDDKTFMLSAMKRVCSRHLHHH